MNLDMFLKSRYLVSIDETKQLSPKNNHKLIYIIKKAQYYKNSTSTYRKWESKQKMILRYQTKKILHKIKRENEMKYVLKYNKKYLRKYKKNPYHFMLSLDSCNYNKKFFSL